MVRNKAPDLIRYLRVIVYIDRHVFVQIDHPHSSVFGTLISVRIDFNATSNFDKYRQSIRPLLMENMAFLLKCLCKLVLKTLITS